MAVLCTWINDCTSNDGLSVAAIVGIVIGILSLLAGLIVGIVFFCMLHKRKRQLPIVWVAQRQPAIINSYPSNSQTFEFNNPAPSYQGEPIAAISGRIIE